MQDLVGVISNVGFPIVCVVYLFKFIAEQQEKNYKREEKLIEQMDKFNTSLTEITTILRELDINNLEK